MFKKLFLILIVVLFLFACAGPSKDPVMNNQTSESGDTVWTGSYFNVAAQIDKTFKFVGTQDKSDQRVRRKYYVYDAEDGHFIYIVEIKMKGTWTFPKDYNPLLGKDQKINDPNLLFLSSDNSAWAGMQKRSYDLITEMGVEIPKCKILVQQAKISPSRSGGAWIVMSTPSSCNRTKAEIDTALTFYSNVADLR